jgi:peroxiredoxin
MSTRTTPVRRGGVDERTAARHRRRVRAGWVAGTLVIVAVIAAMVLTSRPATTASATPAPDFTLTSTSGARVHLADLRGHDVLLYFNEGAGCQSCLVQMAAIEARADELADLDLTVLPIVMNTREQITADMAANGVKTPFLLDDGTVSQAYGTLGRGMHAGLPGHSFVLIDASGVKRWYGEYPSMWLAPDELFATVRDHLAG